MADPQPDDQADAVPVKRLVLFIPGYFYFTPRYFRALFAHHAKQPAAQLSGLTIKGQAKGEGMAVFEATLPGQPSPPEHPLRADQSARPAVIARYAVLTWEQLAHARMQRPAWRRLASGLELYARGVLRGSPVTYARLSRGYLSSWLYPLVILLLVLAGASILGALAAWGLGPWGLLLAPVTLVIAIWVLHRHDRRLRVLFLMDAFAWAQAFGDGRRTGIEPHLARMEAQARELLAQAHAEGFSEAIIVGHSYGTMVATVLADRLAMLPAKGASPPLRLLTAGALHPIVATQPKAGWYREILRRRITDRSLPWVELYAKQDVLCFGPSSPKALLAGRDRTAPVDGPWPRMRTIRPREMMSNKDYENSLMDRFRFHMLYLTSSQLAKGWSFPRLILSHRPLLDAVERFHAKKDGWS